MRPGFAHLARPLGAQTVCRVGIPAIDSEIMLAHGPAAACGSGSGSGVVLPRASGPVSPGLGRRSRRPLRLPRLWTVFADEAGHWTELAAAPTATDRPLPADLRRLAIEQFKLHGITHILLNKGDFVAADFQQKTEEWGVSLVGKAGDDCLYEIK